MYLSSMSRWKPRRVSGSNLPDSLLLFSSCALQMNVLTDMLSAWTWFNRGGVADED